MTKLSEIEKKVELWAEAVNKAIFEWGKKVEGLEKRIAELEKTCMRINPLEGIFHKMNSYEEAKVTKHLKNINGAYEALRKIKSNIESVKNGEYSYNRCFYNILELTYVALEYITREL